MEDAGMKVTRELRKLTTTQTEMARVLGISQQRVSQLLQEEVMTVDDDGGLLVVESLKNFYKLRDGKALDGNEPNYMAEKALHERVKREIAELKLAKMENSVYDAKTVELVMTEQLSNLRTQLLGLPSKLAPILEEKGKDEIYETMTREIEEKLMELSEYTPDLFTEEFVEDDDEEVE
jgi:predicted transcriptional regulator